MHRLLERFSYKPPRWLRRITSTFGLVLAPIVFVLAINQIAHPGSESRMTDVLVLLATIVVLAVAICNFGVEWLGWKPGAGARS